MYVCMYIFAEPIANTLSETEVGDIQGNKHITRDNSFKKKMTVKLHIQTKSESNQNRKGKQQKDNETKSHCEGKTEQCVIVDCRDLNMP